MNASAPTDRELSCLLTCVDERNAVGSRDSALELLETWQDRVGRRLGAALSGLCVHEILRVALAHTHQDGPRLLEETAHMLDCAEAGSADCRVVSVSHALRYGVSARNRSGDFAEAAELADRGLRLTTETTADGILLAERGGLLLGQARAEHGQGLTRAAIERLEEVGRVADTLTSTGGQLLQAQVMLARARWAGTATGESETWTAAARGLLDVNSPDGRERALAASVLVKQASDELRADRPTAAVRLLRELLPRPCSRAVSREVTDAAGILLARAAVDAGQLHLASANARDILNRVCAEAEGRNRRGPPIDATDADLLRAAQALMVLADVAKAEADAAGEVHALGGLAELAGENAPTVLRRLAAAARLRGGLRLRETGDFDAAEEAFAQLYARYHRDGVTNVSDLAVQGQLELLETLLRRGDLDRALDAVQHLTTELRVLTVDTRLHARTLLKAGDVFMNRDIACAASQAYEPARDALALRMKQPSDPLMAHAQLKVVLATARLGSTDDAMLEIERLVSLGRSTLDLLDQLADSSSRSPSGPDHRTAPLTLIRVATLAQMGDGAGAEAELKNLELALADTASPVAGALAGLLREVADESR